MFGAYEVMMTRTSQFGARGLWLPAAEGNSHFAPRCSQSKLYTVSPMSWSSGISTIQSVRWFADELP
jgi:hypothetical protein